jgi:hypothetical protein
VEKYPHNNFLTIELISAISILISSAQQLKECENVNVISKCRLPQAVLTSELMGPKQWGGRAFAVDGARLWNSVPDEITNCQSLLTYHHWKLKTLLFRQSFAAPNACVHILYLQCVFNRF